MTFYYHKEKNRTWAVALRHLKSEISYAIICGNSFKHQKDRTPTVSEPSFFIFVFLNCGG